MSESGPFSGANADNETEFSDSDCGELLVTDDTDGDEQVYLAASNTASTPSDNSVHNESPPFGANDESPADGESTPHSPFDDIKNVLEALALLEAAQREENYIEMRLSLATFQAEFMTQETAQQQQMITQIGDQLKQLEDKIKEYVPKTRRTVLRGPSAPVQRRASTPPRIVPLQPVVYWRGIDGSMQQTQSRKEARKRRLQEERLEEEIF